MSITFIYIYSKELIVGKRPTTLTRDAAVACTAIIRETSPWSKREQIQKTTARQYAEWKTLEHLPIHQFLPLQAQGTCGKRGGKRLRAKEVENTKKSKTSKHTWTTHILIYELTETVASGTGPEWVHTRLSPRAESRHMYPSLSRTLSPINSHLQTKK